MTVKHATVSVFVFHEGSSDWRLGLIEHPRLGRSMIPGGHVEVDETQAEAALREVVEESGLRVRLVAPPTPPAPVGFPHALVAAPWWITEQDVPVDNHLGEPHVHVDHQYVAVADSPVPVSTPVHPFGWHGAGELAVLPMLPSESWTWPATMKRMPSMSRWRRSGWSRRIWTPASSEQRMLVVGHQHPQGAVVGHDADSGVRPAGSWGTHTLIRWSRSVARHDMNVGSSEGDSDPIAGGDVERCAVAEPPRRPPLGGAAPKQPGQGGNLWRLLLTVTSTMILFGALTIVAIFYTQGNDPLIPQPGTRARASIIVQNKVVTSAVGLVEDRTPAYLSSRPISRCTKRRCKIEGTEVASGARLVAVCFTFGEGMTNMDLHSSRARRNPDRISSDLWYGVRLTDHSLGFISEVYLTPASRKGLGLRKCPDPP